MAKRGSQIREFTQLRNQSVTIPARNAGEAPIELHPITYNPLTIKTLKDLVGGLKTELEQLQQQLVDRNQAGHEPMRSGILPDFATANRKYDAHDRYRKVLPAMLHASNDDEQTHMPRLNAGMPPEMDKVAEEIQQKANDYRQDMASTAGGDSSRTAESALSAQEIQRLNQRKKESLRRKLKERAQELNLYAQTDENAQGFPLQWSSLRTANPPQPYEVWEAQLGLWIQQDILEAIAQANHVGEDGASVINAPVKRLISLQVVPGYVGLHTRGGVLSGSGTATLPYQLPKDYKAPDEDEVVRNFLVSPTGRVSNPVYDVRHARLEIIADYQKLPELFDAISNVNLMTVVSCQIKDVDEYDAYKQGYVYGDADAVQVTLVIETLWMRQWTGPLMPDTVRQYLGMPKREKPEETEEPEQSATTPAESARGESSLTGELARQGR